MKALQLKKRIETVMGAGKEVAFILVLIFAISFIVPGAFGFALVNLSSQSNLSEVAANFSFVGEEGWVYPLLGMAVDVKNCVDLHEVGLDSRFQDVVRGSVPQVWPRLYWENCTGEFLWEIACGNEINRSFGGNSVNVSGVESVLGISDEQFNRSAFLSIIAAWPNIFNKVAPSIAQCANGTLLWNCTSDVNCSNGRQFSIYCDGQNVVMDQIMSTYCIAPGNHSGCGMNVVKSVAVDCGGKGCNMSSGECYTSAQQPCVTQPDGTACTDSYGVSGVCSGGSCYVDVLKLGLVLYVPFDDGTANDKSGNGYTPLVNGSSFCLNCGVRGSGAYVFNSAINYINYSGPSKTAMGSSNFTVSFWVKPNYLQLNKGIFLWANALSAGNAWIAFGGNSPSTVAWFYSGGNHVMGLNAGDWNYLALTFNGTVWKTYLNGTLVGSPVASARGTNGGNNPFLGNAYNGYFNGTIDEFRIYNRSLNLTEVQRLYNLSRPIACYSDDDCLPNMSCSNPGRYDAKCIGLVLYFSFNSSDQPVQDGRGRGYNGTVNGATWTPNGKFGGAYVFTTVPSNITVRSFPRMATYTVSAWINPAVFSSFSNYRGIVYDNPYTGAGFGAPYSWGLFLGSMGDIRSLISNYGVDYQEIIVDYMNAINYSGWHNIILTDNSTVRKFYRDGVLVHAEANTFVNKEFISNLTIGSSDLGSGYPEIFNGSIDELKIFNYALNDSQVANLFCPGIACFNDADCGLMHKCENPGICGQASCCPVACFNDADCGLMHKCENPGICGQASCCPVACFNDADCGALELCQNNGACNSQCQACGTPRCGANNPCQSGSCINPDTCRAYCNRPTLVWYTFTDAQSPVPDLSGRNHEGILKGTPTWMAEGKPVGSYYFNGSSGTSIDDSIIIDDAVLGDFNFTNSSSFTIMAWIKPKPVTSNDCAPNRRLIFVYDPYAEGKSIADRTVLQFALMDSYSSNPDALIVKYGGPNGGYNLIGPAVVNDAWQHVAVTRNVTAEGIKVSLYLNGSLFSSGMDTTSGPWNLTGSVPRIGGLYDDCSAYSGGYWYNGSIGDFRIYNSSLSEGELQNIWETTK